MTDEEWQAYRADYALRHNVYLVDTPEIRMQHDAYPGLSEALQEPEEEEEVHPSLTVIEGGTEAESASEWQVIEEDANDEESAEPAQTEHERLLKLMGTSINNKEKGG